MGIKVQSLSLSMINTVLLLMSINNLHANPINLTVEMWSLDFLCVIL
ncbi:protein YmgL [Escherichia coli]